MTALDDAREAVRASAHLRNRSHGPARAQEVIAARDAIRALIAHAEEQDNLIARLTDLVGQVLQDFYVERVATLEQQVEALEAKAADRPRS